MKRIILTIIAIFFLIISGLNVYALETNDFSNDKNLIKNHNYSFTTAKIELEETYVKVCVPEATSYLKENGKPVLPVYTRTYTFPIGTKINDVKFSINDIFETKLSQKIKPAPNSVPKISLKNFRLDSYFMNNFKDKSVYLNSDLYPDSWFNYEILCGKTENRNVISLNVICYLARYSSPKDTMYQIKDFDIDIKYELPEPKEDLSIDVLATNYDMVIISPSSFASRLQPLVDHKNNMGVKTYLKTTEDIYKEADLGAYIAEGRDKAEKIKLFIHWAEKNLDIDYVLLVGGKNIVGTQWYVPVRYSNLDDDKWGDPNWETSYLSDLYFSDIYKYDSEQGYVFDDWDSNGNNVFAEWTYKWVYNETYQYWKPVIDKKDILDLFPDVYIGRLPCRSVGDVKTVVNKIITYETETYGSNWFNRFIVAGGDTTPPVDNGDPGIYEGEIITDLSASYLEPLGFETTRLWTSDGSLKRPRNLYKELNKGAGFVHLSGHGSPIDWGTHPPDTNLEQDWIDGLLRSDIKWLINYKKYPIFVVGGCHNSQFDVGITNFFEGLKIYGLDYFVWNQTHDCFWKWEWISRCVDWSLVREKNGGAIAAIGNTGIGWESYDEGCTDDLTGWIEPRFFYNYANTDANNRTLGRIHSDTLSDFIFVFNPNFYNNGRPRKTVEEWALLGDPSLKIGGYPNQ